MVAAKRRFFDDNGFGVSPLKPAITAMLMFHPNLKPFCYNKLSVVAEVARRSVHDVDNFATLLNVICIRNYTHPTDE